MKKRVLIFALIGLVAMAAAVGFVYFSGNLIPNERAAAAFAIRGVDVSHHQGTIDWSAVALDKIGFAYIKATEGGDFRDEQFLTNWTNAAAHRIPRGAYHFFTFKTSGALQAENFISTVPVDSTALPPAVDLEFWGNSRVRPTVSEFQKELNALMTRLREAYGKEPVIYTTDDFYAQYLIAYPVKRLWIRNILYKPRSSEPLSWLLWQFTDKGRVRGIQTLVDLNAFAGDQAAFDAIFNKTEVWERDSKIKSIR